MQGRDDMTTRELLSELGRDVKWICLTLQEIKESINDHENRLRSLESFKSGEIANRGTSGLHRESGFGDFWEIEFLKDSKLARLCAGIGAGAGGIVAVLLRLFG